MYEVRRDGTLSSRRLFASVGIYDGSSPGLGLPDGIKVDTKGHIYVGSPDGVQGVSLSHLLSLDISLLSKNRFQAPVLSLEGFLKPFLKKFLGDRCTVFSRTGKPLGLIVLPDSVNLGFAGKNLNQLYILNDSSVHMIELKVRGTFFTNFSAFFQSY